MSHESEPRSAQSEEEKKIESDLSEKRIFEFSKYVKERIENYDLEESSLGKILEENKEFKNEIIELKNKLTNPEFINTMIKGVEGNVQEHAVGNLIDCIMGNLRRVESKKPISDLPKLIKVLREKIQNFYKELEEEYNKKIAA